jgi:class 3 adenylate cyclase
VGAFRLFYKPTPIDTSKVTLDREITELVEQLARNTHENWASLRMAEGWRYGTERNDARKEHPDLIPFDQLPESEKEYDRQTALQAIKVLVATGYSIQREKTPSVSPQTAAVAFDKTPTEVLRILKAPTAPDLASSQALWRARDPEAWATDPETYRLFGARLLKLGEPLVAYDAISEGMKSFPRDIRLRQLLALALARSGAAGSANAVLKELYEEDHRDEETVGLLARTYKDLANEAASTVEANQHLRHAYELYTQAYETTGGYWSAINAATLALILGDRRTAASFAQQVGDQCLPKLAKAEAGSSDRYWLLSTLGEAALLLDNWDAAKDWYEQALAEGAGNWGSLQSTCHNARSILKHLGKDDGRLENVFRFPTVVVFAGHMIDRSNREAPRFPIQMEAAVKNAIRERIEKFNAGFGYGSAACGADILFHEVMLDRNGESHVVLPNERKQFIKESVDIIPGGNWVERSEKVMAKAVEVQEISKQLKTQSLSYEFADRILHGIATMRAHQLETKLIPLAVWDGKPGDGQSGTADTVERWQCLGLKVEIIDLRKILVHEFPQAANQVMAADVSEARHAEAESGFASEIRALLFADAEGFSKLGDEEVPRFVEHFLGLVGDLASNSENRPLTKNTWGDGLYFVFENVKHAGQFALDLRDRVRAMDWASKGLPELRVRIGLHAGPVHSCIDPVTKHVNYIGTHVSRAARIEPITPSGQVYASQSFAALAAAQGIQEFRCDYVGQTSLAKHYGTFPTYVVLRRRVASAEASIAAPRG